MNIEREIKTLKKQARQSYEAYDAMLSDLSCGAQVGEYIRPQAVQYKEAFNAAMARLEEIDPNCPKGKRL